MQNEEISFSMPRKYLPLQSYNRNSGKNYEICSKLTIKTPIVVLQRSGLLKNCNGCVSIYLPVKVLRTYSPNECINSPTFHVDDSPTSLFYCSLVLQIAGPTKQ